MLHLTRYFLWLSVFLIPLTLAIPFPASVSNSLSPANSSQLASRGLRKSWKNRKVGYRPLSSSADDNKDEEDEKDEIQFHTIQSLSTGPPGYYYGTFSRQSSTRGEDVLIEKSQHKRVLNGAQLQKSLESPYILEVKAYFPYASNSHSRETEYVVIMQYATTSLVSYVETNRHDPSLVKGVEQLLQGLVTIHAAKIALRNIGPQSVMYLDGPKWFNFGWAIRATEDTTSTQRILIRGFAAPELMVGIPYEDSQLVGYPKEVAAYSPIKGDIWAMGMMLIYMLMIPDMRTFVEFWQNSESWNTQSDIESDLSGGDWFAKPSTEMIELLSNVLRKDPDLRLGAGSFLIGFRATPEYQEAVGSS